MSYKELGEKPRGVKEKKMVAQSPLKYQFIDTAESLQAIVKKLLKSPAIAVDLEADSLYHYKERVCLLQVSNGKINAVIDPIKIGDLSALKPIFANTKIRKIFHGADYDIRSLYRDFKIQVRNLFDTQIASMFLGFREISLEAVLQKRFKVKLNKSFQKKNWSQRPLPQEMVEYAAEDARHLIPLAAALDKELAKKERISWVEEECRILSRVRSASDNSLPFYLKFKGAGKLPPRNLAALEALLQLRDRKAREKDRPHFKIFSNASLLKIANRLPKSLTRLKSIEALSTRQISMYGKDIVSEINAVLALKPETLPAYPKKRAPRIPPDVPDRIRVIRDYRDQLALELSLDPALVLNKALISAIAIRNPLTVAQLKEVKELKNWQRKLLGKHVVALLRKMAATNKINAK